ncbi:MAG: hypothetical protein LBF83_05245 [Spirochaetaceae bacterium]|jgi:hypothetical protein|nr:hypothetical protein [Spirochaetaceae bacterium]
MGVAIKFWYLQMIHQVIYWHYESEGQYMNDESNDLTAIKLAELECLTKEFKERFEAGASDVDNFITMIEIERMWSELQNNTQIIY